ncbi:MAG: single-stranded DNA-binding protein [Bacteroidales bacterium]|nr:single-stranded DNA-binding protein [Bacteroidales bacterium]
MLKLQVIGNLGSDAKVNEVNGRKAINFNIAENRNYKDKEGIKHEVTTWLNCTMWKDNNQSVEIVKYLKKGTKVYIEGLPAVQTYVNKEKKTIGMFGLNVRNIELLSKKTEEESTFEKPSEKVNKSDISEEALPSNDGMPF